MLTKLFEVLCRFEADVDFTYFGVNAGSNKNPTGVVGDPDLHLPFLFEEPTPSEHVGLDAVAPNIAEYSLLALARRYANRYAIDEARVADIERGGISDGQRQRANKIECGNNIVRRAVQITGDRSRGPHGLVRVGLDPCNRAIRVIEGRNAVADLLLLNVVFLCADRAKVTCVGDRIDLL